MFGHEALVSLQCVSEAQMRLWPALTLAVIVHRTVVGDPMELALPAASLRRADTESSTIPDVEAAAGRGG
jgi:hypothetical protein